MALPVLPSYPVGSYATQFPSSANEAIRALRSSIDSVIDTQTVTPAALTENGLYAAQGIVEAFADRESASYLILRTIAGFSDSPVHGNVQLEQRIISALLVFKQLLTALVF